MWRKTVCKEPSLITGRVGLQNVRMAALKRGLGGLPLIMYAARGGGGVNTNAYKCVQGGRGGLNMTKNTHFVRRCYNV